MYTVFKSIIFIRYSVLWIIGMLRVTLFGPAMTVYKKIARFSKFYCRNFHVSYTHLFEYPNDINLREIYDRDFSKHKDKEEGKKKKNSRSSVAYIIESRRKISRTPMGERLRKWKRKKRHFIDGKW